MTLRVLHLLAATNRRGAEVHAGEVKRAVAALQPDWTQSIVALTEAQTSVRVEGTALTSRPWWHAVPRLRHHMKQADVVIAHGSSSLPASVVAGWRLDTPVIYRSIGDPSYWSSRGLAGRRTNLLLRRVSAVVALWPEAATSLAERRLGGATVQVIPNAVDSALFPTATTPERAAARARLRLPEDAPLALYIGAFSGEKDPLFAARVVASMPTVHLRMVGAGPLRADLEAVAATSSGRIEIMGPTDRPLAYLQAADVLVLSSHTEGVPGAMLEAAALGVPSVAPFVGGIGSMFDGGIPGVGFTPGSVADFRQALLESLTIERPTTGRIPPRFELDTVAIQWRDLIVDVVSGAAT